MDDVYKNIREYNPRKKCKILIVLDDIIAIHIYIYIYIYIYCYIIA